MEAQVRRIHERWKQRSEAAFQRMFGGKSEAELETLTQREEMALLISRELAAFLLEEHVALDPTVRPTESSPGCCPKCGREGTPAVEGEEELPERTVMTRTGEIGVRRQRWRCKKCRVIFFSA